MDALPGYARIIRGWSGHLDLMMFGLGPEFAAAIDTGYHAKAGSEANPLAHTLTTRINRPFLNGEIASEFTLNAVCAARYGVPSTFLAGDIEICADARAMLLGLVTVETLKEAGYGSDSLSRQRAWALIRDGVERSLSTDPAALIPEIRETYEVVIEFNNPSNAYRASWYPGASAHGSCAVAFAATEYSEIQRALRLICL
jgi:D-amino peptidase